MDVKQEKRIDDYWNIDGSRDVSGSWTGFTQFTLLEEKPPDGYMWSGGRLTKLQVTSRPDHFWPELWIKLGRNAKLKERQKWSNKKTKLDNARRLRGIHSIDPGDKEFKETIENARKKLENTDGSYYALQDKQDMYRVHRLSRTLPKEQDHLVGSKKVIIITIFCVFSKEFEGFTSSREEKEEEGKGEGGRRMEQERAGPVFLTFRMVTGRATARSERRSAWTVTCAHHGQISLMTLLQKSTFSAEKQHFSPK